jgi:two-component system response regulator YesN
MYKVLIADDEQIIRKGLCTIIDWNALGYSVIGEAQNGKEVLTFIAENHPDVVLIDIRMPLLHGLEAIRQARESGYDGKFIILSGYSDFTYAQDAIKYGVSDYFTKPVDEEQLSNRLIQIRGELDEKQKTTSSNEFYHEKAKESLMRDFLRGTVNLAEISSADLGLDASRYQVILYEKYSYQLSDTSYDLSELLRVSNQNPSAHEFLTIDNQHVILLNGEHAIRRFHDMLAKYEGELPPQKNSPLDSIFLSCGRVVEDAAEIPFSYRDAALLLAKRFFCAQHQHIVSYDHSDGILATDKPSRSAEDFLRTYVEELANHIQSYNRNKIAETLHRLEQELYYADMTVEAEKNLLIDLYLHIKEKISFLYHASKIPFTTNSEAINTIQHSFYLYEIIAFLSEQFELIMNAIGHSSRESIIDDIVYYIEHNYSENITLENIAPLFGYNSSYLGKIFSKKMGINFNTYLDNVRIEHSKELLVKNKLQVYKIAELVGYRNVDYFHIKFKKGTGISPAEYRKQHTATA